MADFSILTEVVPELSTKPEDELKTIWRDWANNQPAAIREWLTRPLRPEERRILQCEFAVTWYRTESLAAQDKRAEVLKADQEAAEQSAADAERPYRGMEGL